MILRFLIAPCPQKAFHGRERMARTEGVLLDRRGSEVDDLIEARERAIGVVRTIMSRPGPRGLAQMDSPCQ